MSKCNFKDLVTGIGFMRRRCSHCGAILKTESPVCITDEDEKDEKDDKI